ncbi:MAG TPA: SGNH/GDSL hydrolase family protein [Chryseolinea sp.]
MKLFTGFTVGSLLIALASFTMVQKKKIIFFGDSITQAGVNPGGYIVKIGELAAKENLATQYDFVGAGIGGNKVYDLYLRMEDDVLSKKPDIVVIYVGVNDVWHKRSYGTGTDPDKFEKFYNALIKKMQAQNIKIILCTPAAIGERTDFSNELDGDLNNYSTIIRGIAKKNGLLLVDLRQAFLDYNKQHNLENKEAGILTSDRVHLNEKGNQLVADEMWKAIKAIEGR